MSGPREARRSAEAAKAEAAASSASTAELLTQATTAERPGKSHTARLSATATKQAPTIPIAISIFTAEISLSITTLIPTAQV